MPRAHRRTEIRDEVERREAAHRHEPQQRELEERKDVLERSKRLGELDVEIPADRAHDSVVNVHTLELARVNDAVVKFIRHGT